MSNFTRNSINPATGKYEIATWLDDYYGPHRYGVRFQDGKIYPEEAVTGGPLPSQPTGKEGES